MAKTVGATHTLLSSEDIVQDVKMITGGNGTTISLECVGRLSVIEQALASTARRGALVLVGAAPPTDVLQLPASEFMMTGKRIMGCTEGDSTPSTVWYFYNCSASLANLLSSFHSSLNGIGKASFLQTSSSNSIM